MPFDPKAYIAENKKQSGFDPKSYIADHSDHIDPNSYHMPEEIETFGKTAGNSATLGYLPQIEGAIKASQGGDYVNERDKAIEDLENLSKRNPKSAMAGNFVGTVGPAMLTGGMGVLGSEASLGAKAIQGAKISGMQGIAANPGDVKGEIGLQIPERLANAGTASLMGAGTTAASEYVPSIASKVSNFIKEGSFRKGYEALGGGKRFSKQDYIREKMGDIGDSALKNGVIGWWPRGKEKLLERAEGLQEQSGKKVGDTIKRLSEKEQKLLGNVEASDQAVSIPGAPKPSGGISTDAIAKSLEDDLIKAAPEGTALPGLSKQNAFYKEMIDEFNTGKPMSLQQAHDLKVMLGSREQNNPFIKWDRLPGTDIQEKEQFYRSLYTKLNKATEDAAEFLSGKEGTLSAFKEAKQDYGSSKRMQEILKDRIAADIANRKTGLTDYITGAGGAAIGGMIGDTKEERMEHALMGAGLGKLNKLGRKYGPQVTAKIGSAAASGLSKIATGLENKPGLIPQVAERIREKFAQKNGSGDKLNLDPQVLESFKKDPSLIEMLGDEKLKRLIKQELSK